MPAAVSIRSFVRGCSAASAPAHVVAVHAGQVAVEHHDVVAAWTRAVEERRGPVGRHVDRHALPAQPARDRGGDARLVLGDQDAHAPRR